MRHTYSNKEAAFSRTSSVDGYRASRSFVFDRAAPACAHVFTFHYWSDFPKLYWIVPLGLRNAVRLPRRQHGFIWSMKMLSLKHTFLPILDELFATPGGPSSGMSGGKFLAEAMRENLLEVQACNLAIEKATREEVKAFCQKMMDEHSRIGRLIEELAGKKQIQLPTDLTAKQKAELEKLSQFSGEEFDRRFAGFNVREHEHEIRHYEEQTQQGTDPEIKAYAERVVKMLSRELEKARKLEQALQAS
jgi:putative membrane protein